MAVLGTLGAALLSSACAGNHRDQPYLQVFEEPYPVDDAGVSGPSSPRVPPEDTVARGQLRDDPALYTGKDARGQYVTEFPFRVTEEFVRRGQERYEINCVPCHDPTGTGRGMIVRRGFQQPPSYHEDRLRRESVGRLYEVVMNGQGAMAGYGDQVAPRDRWAIVAYIRALQLSQNANAQDAERARAIPVPTAEGATTEEGGQPAGPEGNEGGE